MILLPRTCAALALAGLLAAAPFTQDPAVGVAASSVAAPSAAAGHRAVFDVLRDRWKDWVGDKDEVRGSDLVDEAAHANLHGDDAAACAALIQTLHWLDRKQHVDHAGRDALLDGTDEKTARMLRSCYEGCLRKQAAIPTALWRHEGPSVAAVTQSGDRTGDCWLLAPTGWMVRNRPDVLRRCIEDLGGGAYRVTFPYGESVEVRLPSEVEMVCVNAMPTLDDGLWLPVIKEAMGAVLARHNPKKAAIESESLRLNGGSLPMMMQRWTGHACRTLPMEGKAAPADVRAMLEEALARKAMVGAGTGKEPKGNIPPNHAYMVFGFDRGRDMVITWNPWNNEFKPKGPSNRENGYARHEGIAEIPLADFAGMFRGLTVETDRPWDGTSMPERK